MTQNTLLKPTPLLDFNHPSLNALITARGWRELPDAARVGAAYDFVRDEIAFGYNRTDALPASEVLKDGYGQCNTKTILLMALLRALGVPCRFHGFTIHKRLQRGVVPEALYALAPEQILHSWVEIALDGAWITLEGFILDLPLLHQIQRAFPKRRDLCAYGIGTLDLQNPGVQWRGVDTFIQKTGIEQDFGRFDTPDAFYAKHAQLTGWRGVIYRHGVRHWMNARVARMRTGTIPAIPNLPNPQLPATQEPGHVR